MPSDELFACETGTALWNAYRAAHPDGPSDPEVLPEVFPNAPPELVAYWLHMDTCGDCMELQEL